MKVCKVCGKTKKITAFYKRSKNKADGRRNQCKECMKLYMAERPRERLAEIDRKRNAKPKRRADCVRYVREGRKREPQKHRARATLQYAVRTGRLYRLPCEVCGEKNTQGHHSNYEKPLDVRWLCREHHDEVHRILKQKEAC